MILWLIRSKFELYAKLFPILIAKAKKWILWRISWHNCLYNYIFSCFSPLYFSHFDSFPWVRSYNGFYSKTRAWEGVEHLLIQLVAMALVVINNFFPTPCFVHRVDAEPPVFRDGTACSPLFSVPWHRVQRNRAPELLRRGSGSMAKLAAATS